MNLVYAGMLVYADVLLSTNCLPKRTHCSACFRNQACFQQFNHMLNWSRLSLHPNYMRVSGLIAAVPPSLQQQLNGPV